MTSEGLRNEVRLLCAAIAAGSTDPVVGARRIWVLLADENYPPELNDFRVFVGMVSEIDDHPEHRAGYTADIVAEARRVVRVVS